MAPHVTFSQEGLILNTNVGTPYHAAVDPEAGGAGLELAQSITFEGGHIEHIRFAMFDMHSIDGHTGVIEFHEGGPYGDLLWTEEFVFPGLGKLFSEEELAGVTSANQLPSFWNDAATAGLDFDSLATTFVVGEYFSSGLMTIVVRLDNYQSIDRPPYLSSFGNCSDFWCGSNTVLNPYPEGNFFRGLTLTSSVYPNTDLAFEVRYRPELSTGIGSKEASRFFVPVNAGHIIVPSDWFGSSLQVTDVAGREFVSQVVYGGESLPVPQDQVLVVTLTTSSARKSTKVFVH